MEFKTNFDQVEEHPSFPKNEEKILEYWKKIDAFKTQLEKTKNYPMYTFYDGPPFATGMPHYGHLTAGGLKDVVTRYWTQRGYYVPRRFGWDCHGLPIECIINKKLNISTKKELNAIGIEKYNEECRKIIMTYADDWKYYTERYGRWIDFENDYRTMYPSYMETVWWIFKQIYEKGRVYRKCKVMPFSCACNTVLSNFEAGENYQTVNDPSVVITFPLVSDPKIKLLAWTTTPWTLPSNLYLVVHEKMTYVHIKANGDDEQQYILAESRLKEVMKQIKVNDKYEIIKKCQGKDLFGLEYIPLFTTFYDKFKPKGCFKVYTADYVTAEDGTGVVHNAPGFGEDDYQVGIKYNLIDPDCPLCPMDEDGCFTDEFPMTKGIYFKKADPIIIDHLKKEKRLLFQGTIAHSYPFCYRTNTPLMYRAIPSWFVRVEDMRELLCEMNKSTYWVPKYVQEKRFHNWLANARDWCISRNRSWGTPIPLWVSDDFEEKVAVGSIKELEELSGVKIDDLHREIVDKITIPSKMGKGVLKRIPEVFDCWFESGSMPYAQVHYPFELNEEEFLKGFPADFIAEGLDQTRGWFYTLNIIAAILFKKTPYKNLIVNGLVLDEKGEKLSKSKGNYKDSKILFDTYGADVVRLYLIDSPLVKGQSLKFTEKGLNLKIKDVFLPLHNSYRFLIQNIFRYEIIHKKNFIYNPDILFNENLNITDKWIIAYEQRLIKFLHQEMEHYRLYTVVSELLVFLDKLTNWYIRLNRGRIKGDFGDEECVNSLNILFGTLLNLILLLSPFIPFITEEIYQNLKKGLDKNSPLFEESIHFLRIPEYNEKLLDSKIETIMNNMISVIELGRKLRENKKILLKKPVSKITVINYDVNFLENLKIVENYIIDELNTNSIEYLSDEDKYIELGIKPNFEVLFKKCKEVKDTMITENKLNDPELLKEEAEYKKESNAISAAIKKLKEAEIRQLMKDGQFVKDGVTISSELVVIEKKFLPKYKNDKINASMANSDCGIIINTETNEEIMNSYFCREIINRIQKLRKESGISIHDNIVIIYAFGDKCERIKNVSNTMKDTIEKAIKTKYLDNENGLEGYHEHKTADYEIGDEKEKIIIKILKK